MRRTVGVAFAGALAVAWLVAACGRMAAPPREPLLAEEHNDLGVAYYAGGEHERAARQFRQALALRPGWPGTLVKLGDAELALGRVEAAIAAYEAAHRASPGDPAIANNLAWALLQDDRRWPQAEPIIQSALALEPRPRGYYLDTQGVLLLRKGDLQGALETLRAALSDQDLRDRQARALVLRHAAQALRRLGDREAAERCEHLAQATESGEGPGAREGIGGSEALC